MVYGSPTFIGLNTYAFAQKIQEQQQFQTAKDGAVVCTANAGTPTPSVHKNAPLLYHIETHGCHAVLQCPSATTATRNESWACTVRQVLVEKLKIPQFLITAFESGIAAAWQEDHPNSGLSPSTQPHQSFRHRGYG